MINDPEMEKRDEQPLQTHESVNDSESAGQEEPERLKLEPKDRWAILIAAWRVILPYGFIVVIVYFLLLLIFDKLF